MICPRAARAWAFSAQINFIDLPGFAGRLEASPARGEAELPRSPQSKAPFPQARRLFEAGHMPQVYLYPCGRGSNFIV
jgi:hypothetical protein